MDKDVIRKLVAGGTIDGLILDEFYGKFLGIHPRYGANPWFSSDIRFCFFLMNDVAGWIRDNERLAIQAGVNLISISQTAIINPSFAVSYDSLLSADWFDHIEKYPFAAGGATMSLATCRAVLLLAYGLNEAKK